MLPLIAELKQEHQTIVQLLNDVDSLGVESAQGRHKLMEAQDIFMNHLKKEDEQVHALLSEAEKNSPDLREIMYLMHFNLKDVSRFVIEFFEKYASTDNQEEFASDYNLIRVLLQNRIRREERVLFREFEKVAHA